jgi:hypothetical protein
MDNNSVRRQKSFPGRMGTLLCMWFLAGMPVSMFLSGIYAFVGMPLPPLFYFLSSMVYLTGGLLGCMWSRESLRRNGLSIADVFIMLFILILGVGFLLLSIVFIVIGFQRF